MVAVVTLGLLGGAAAPAWSAPVSPARGERVVGTLVRADATRQEEAAGAHEASDHGHLAGHGFADQLAWIEDGSASGVRVDAGDLDHVPSGARVEAVVGAPTDDGAPGLVPAREVLAARVVATPPGGRSVLAGVPDAAGAGGLAAALTPSRHAVSVVMAVPAGGARGTATLADVVASVDGPTNDFWSSQTGGAVTFAVTATRDYVDLAASCTDPRALWAQAAAAVGFRGGADQHLLVYVGGESPGCGAGLGTVGDSVGSGGSSYVADEKMSIVAHELGHNLGLRHSSKLRCPGTVEASAPGTCTVAEYEDRYDVMGVSWGPTGSLNPVQARQLGVLDPARSADVPARGGRFTLSPVGGGSGLKAVRLADSGGATYWVELREPVGRDAYLGSPRLNWAGLDTGVVVRSAPGGKEPASLLLDATPTGASAWSRDFASALAPARSMLVADGRWRIAVGTSVGEGTTRTAVVTIKPAAPGASALPDGTLTGRPDPDPLVPDDAVTRREGPSRYATAVAVSRGSHPGTSATVVVASGEAFPDALAAGPLAAAVGSPLLLAPRDGALEAGVLAELRRLSPEKVVLAGGRSAVSDAVAAQLARVAPVQRISGADRYETAALLAGATGQRGATVYLSSGATFADAVSGGAQAAREGAVVLLTDRDALPPATRTALATLRPERVVLLGGPASVGLGAQRDAAAAAPGAATVRLGGADRYATAAQVALAGNPGGAGTVYLATGDAFADALAGGPAAGADGAPLLLTARTCVPAPTAAALATLAPQRVVLLGGTGAVAADALYPC